MRFVIVLVMFASILGAQTPRPKAAGGAGQAAAAAPPAGNAENGKKIFSSYGCYECHGYAGQGGGAGARLAPRPIAFPAFLKYVRGPKDQMPPYTEKVVSDKELADIYAFLQTIPQPPAANSIPILNSK